ncbi:hypothetical protein B7494_g4315 [Chlorociboria aeruginascens]|nr:hypothetical protein B7494_g4315 [Chlorociboria aeruginascens]
MEQAGGGGLDTPRTNLGDATYLSTQQLDFDISQEPSFQSPLKDNNNLLQQLQNGRRGAINLRTPKSRTTLGEKRNLPAGHSGGEFTPLLKNATRNSALRSGKENVLLTPAFPKSTGLPNIPEDLSPRPIMETSVYGENSRNGSYMAGTPMPQIDSSTASTPMVLLPRRTEGPGVLQDGNQLSLREQENVIDKIEKENFGLKLKIHFLEEALRKAGPGFSDAALKENTELKVDKITMQKELHQYRKTLTAAEHDVELYRQQILDMQEKVKRRHADEGQREELDRLRHLLEEKETEINRLKIREDKFEDLEDKVHDLESDLREKDRLLDDREDEFDNLKDEADKHTEIVSNLAEALKRAQRQIVELEEQAQSNEELEDAKETIDGLEQDLGHLRNEIQEAKEDEQEALRERDRAQADLRELQDEMANKSITTKGLSRQIEEKANRLQDDLEDLQEKHTALQEKHAEVVRERDSAQTDLEELQDEIANKSLMTKGLSRQLEEKANRLQSDLEDLRSNHATLEEQYADKAREIKKLQDKIEGLNQDGEVREQKLMDKLEIVQSEKESVIRERGALSRELDVLKRDLHQKTDEKALLQTRHDSLTSESSSLQRELLKYRQATEDLQDKLDHEKTLSLASERELRDQYKGEIDRLNDEIDDLRAEVREKERLYDDDSDKWESERRNIEAQKERAEEKAAGLQRTIEKLQGIEGTLSGKEMKLQEAIRIEQERHANQEAILTRQINELNEDVQTRRKSIDVVRAELSEVKEELRLSHREQKSLAEKVQGLEDEVDVLQTSLDEEGDQANEQITIAKQESENLKRQLQALRQDLARAEASSADARAEVEIFQGDLKAREGGQEQLSSLLRDVERQLAKVGLEKRSLQDQLDNINIELYTLRTSNTKLQAERDEFKSQLGAIKHQEEVTLRLDRERLDLRTTTMKLDTEVRRLREENKAAVAERQAIEKDLQLEIGRACAVESRLNTEIIELKRILRVSSERQELPLARKTIQRLEQRVQELEGQLTSSGGQADTTNELSIVRRDLSSARQKESEYAQREAAQKDIVRGLKRQVTDNERKLYEAEIARIALPSPSLSVGDSARKSEVKEVRQQLATAQQSLKDLRSELKSTEKEAFRKVQAANANLQTQLEAWEAEKDKLERYLDETQVDKEDLQLKNTSSEATINRLRDKIHRLEKALETERLNKGEDRTIVLERRDLHEMLRETQIQVESLEIVIKQREKKIAKVTASESELRSKLKRVRDERALHRSKAVSALEQLEDLELQFKAAREAWEVEKKTLSHGVRFPNMSLSINDESEILALKEALEESERRHKRELRGLAMQIHWMNAVIQREEGLRSSAVYVKKYMQLQIDLYEACNKADLELLRRATGIPASPIIPKKPTFRNVAIAVRASIRMRRAAGEWAETRRQLYDKIVIAVEEMKRKRRMKALKNSAV